MKSKSKPFFQIVKLVENGSIKNSEKYGTQLLFRKIGPASNDYEKLLQGCNIGQNENVILEKDCDHYMTLSQFLLKVEEGINAYLTQKAGEQC